MDAITGQIFGRNLPFEIYLAVLDQLNTTDIGFQSSLALLNLSLTSRLNAQIIGDWVTIVVSKAAQRIRDLEKEETIPRRGETDLAILGRLLGGLCTICNNRAKLCPKDELVEGLQLCRPCESIYFPKISQPRVIERFQAGFNLLEDGSSIEQVLLHCTPLATDKGIYYRWEEIYSKTKDVLAELPEYFHDHFCQLHSTNEEFGSYFPLNQKSPSRQYWPQQFILWELGVLEALDNKGLETLPPYKLEIALLNVFRYYFDGKWRNNMSDEDKLRDYIGVVKPWATKSLWDLRPWRLENFPVQRRPGLLMGYLNPSPECLKADLGYSRYQFSCTKIRTLLNIFPGILGLPDTWLECMQPKISIADLNSLPAYMKLHGRPELGIERAMRDFTLEISKKDQENEVSFGERWGPLKFRHCALEPGKEDGVPYRTDIICLQGSAVSVLSRVMVNRSSNYSESFWNDGCLEQSAGTSCKCQWCGIL
jgi:hypothetical protein